MDADKVIVELIAKTEGFDGKVKQSATTAESSLGRIEKAAGRAEQAVTRSTGSSSAAISRFSTSLSRDMTTASAILAAPSSPFVMPVKQGPAVANALRLVSTGASVMGGVLGGVVVTGAIAAAAALYELLSKADDTKTKIAELVEKLKEHAEETSLARTAQQVFGETLEGVTEAIYADEAALKKLNEAEKTAARIALEHAQRRLLTLQGIRDETLANIDLAKSNLAVAQSVAGAGDGALDMYVRFSKELETLEARLGRVDKIIKRQQGNVTNALANRVVEIVGKQSDPIEAIKSKYEGMIRDAKDRAIAEGTVRTTLAAQVRELERQQAVEEKLARTRKSSRDPNRQSGRQINEADARRIVAGIGGTVTSGFRTPEKNRAVDGQPNSFHLKGQALDIAKTAGLTLGKIVKAFEKEGVSLIEKLDEGDHFHVAFGKRGGSGPSAETLARRAQGAADASERREQAYENELASLQAEEIDARQALITSAEEIAKLELAAIEISRTKYADNVASLQEQRKLTAGEAAELLKLNDERAKLRAELVQRREAERQFRLQEQAAQNAVDFAGAQIQDQAEILQGQQALAKTARERHEIERRLLDLQFEEERIKLEAIVAYNERLKLNKNALESERIEAEVAARIAQVRLASIDQRQSNAQAGNDRANAGPLQDLFATLPQTAEEISEAFETIAAGGLSSLADGITDVITGAKSMGEAFKGVAQQIIRDIIQMTIRMLIFKALSAAFGGGGGGIGGFAGGGSVTTATGGPAATMRAGGGAIRGRGGPTSDSIPAMLSNGEFVIRASAARKLGLPLLEALNNGRLKGFSEGGPARSISPMNVPASRMGGGTTVIQQFTLDARGAVMTEELVRGMKAYTDRQAATAGKTAFDAGQKAMPKRFGEYSKLGT